MVDVEIAGAAVGSSPVESCYLTSLRRGTSQRCVRVRGCRCSCRSRRGSFHGWPGLRVSKGGSCIRGRHRSAICCACVRGFWVVFWVMGRGMGNMRRLGAAGEEGVHTVYHTLRVGKRWEVPRPAYLDSKDLGLRQTSACSGAFWCFNPTLSDFLLLLFCSTDWYYRKMIVLGVTCDDYVWVDGWEENHASLASHTHRLSEAVQSSAANHNGPAPCLPQAIPHHNAPT